MAVLAYVKSGFGRGTIRWVINYLVPGDYGYDARRGAWTFSNSKRCGSGSIQGASLERAWRGMADLLGPPQPFLNLDSTSGVGGDNAVVLLRQSANVTQRCAFAPFDATPGTQPYLVAFRLYVLRDMQHTPTQCVKNVFGAEHWKTVLGARSVARSNTVYRFVEPPSRVPRHVYATPPPPVPPIVVPRAYTQTRPDSPMHRQAVQTWQCQCRRSRQFDMARNMQLHPNFYDDDDDDEDAYNVDSIFYFDDDDGGEHDFDTKDTETPATRVTESEYVYEDEDDPEPPSLCLRTYQLHPLPRQRGGSETNSLYRVSSSDNLCMLELQSVVAAAPDQSAAAAAATTPDQSA